MSIYPFFFQLLWLTTTLTTTYICIAQFRWRQQPKNKNCRSSASKSHLWVLPALATGAISLFGSRPSLRRDVCRLSGCQLPDDLPARLATDILGKPKWILRLTMNASHALPKQVLPRRGRKCRHVFPFVWCGKESQATKWSWHGLLGEAVNQRQIEVNILTLDV